MPLREWLKTGLRDLVGDLLESATAPLPKDMFNDKSIKKLLAEHRRGAADHSAVIWLLLNYAAWRSSYLGTQDTPRPTTSHRAHMVA